MKSTKDKIPFEVTYYQPEQPRPAPIKNSLEDGLLHHFFLFSYKPVTWSTKRLWLSLAGLTSLVWFLWQPLGRIARRVAGLYYLFSLFDWLLLRYLPLSGRSYGPIGPQLFVMNLPRLGVVVLSAIIGLVSRPLGLVSFVCLQLFGTLTYLWSMVSEPFTMSTTYQQLSSDKVPDSGLRLLHLSDLHIEQLTQREFDLLEQIQQIQPDMIVITGDYTNLSYVHNPTARAEVYQFLRELDAPYGVYAVLGSPPADPRDRTPALFKGTQIKLLQDEVAVLEFGEGQKLSLIGLNCEHDVQADMETFKHLFALSPDDSMRILLYHSPELMPQVQHYQLELYLCGHTHGGQVRLPYYGAVLTSSITGKRYEMGLYQENDTRLYVSRGIGLEGLSAPRMRLLCPPEIILWTISGEQ